MHSSSLTQTIDSNKSAYYSTNYDFVSQTETLCIACHIPPLPYQYNENINQLNIPMISILTRTRMLTWIRCIASVVS